MPLMDSVKIESIAALHRQTRPFYRGIYESHSLPTDLKFRDGPWFIIIHKKFHAEDIVGHWTTAFLTDSTLSFYDSLADQPNDDTAQFLRSVSDNYLINTQRHQSTTSTACGEFSLSYIDHICHGADHSSVVKLFDSRTLAQNEANAYLYVYGHMLSE